jgi:MATE family multidrug resistance protein
MKSEIQNLIKISIPLILAQIGVVLLGVTDMVMLGNFSDDALKAAGLGNVWIIGTLMFGIGCCLGVDPIISWAIGRGDTQKVRSALINGKVMAIAVAIIISIFWYFTAPILIFFGLDSKFALMANSYAHIQIPSLIPFFMYMVFRQYLIGHEKAKLVAIVLALTNVINILLNWIFIYGVGSLEPMGLFGAGLSSCLMRTSQYVILCLLVYFSKENRPLWVPYSFSNFDLNTLKKVLLMGVPIGLHFMLEAFGFQFTTFLAAKISGDALGGHTILINLEYLFFVLPMAFTLGAAIRLGKAFGEKSKDILIIYKSVLFLSLIGLLLSSLVFYFFGPTLINFYGGSKSILEAGYAGLLGASIFFFFYGLQQVLAGLLRGAGKTVISSLMNIGTLYIIGIPLSAYLGLTKEMGINGLWIGLYTSMIISCVGLSLLNLKVIKSRRVTNS